MYQFIQLLKKGNQPSTPQNETYPQVPSNSECSTYEQFKASGLIGSVSIEENLSTTYKQILYATLEEEV